MSVDFAKFYQFLGLDKSMPDSAWSARCFPDMVVRFGATLASWQMSLLDTAYLGGYLVISLFFWLDSNDIFPHECWTPMFVPLSILEGTACATMPSIYPRLTDLNTA